MDNPIKKILTTLLGLSCFFGATGQDGALEYYQNGFYIKQYSEMAGLVNNSCKNVYRDSRGFLWVGTYKGLSRFDGKQFVNYGIEDGLPGAAITQISEDTLGFIYIATPTGIARYTGYNKGNSTCFHTYEQVNTGRLNSLIAGMRAIDSTTIIFQKTDGAVMLLKKDKLLQLSEKKPGHAPQLLKDRHRYYGYVWDTLRVFDNNFKNVENLYFPNSAYSTASNDNAGNLHLYHKGIKHRLAIDGNGYTSTVPDSITAFVSIDSLDKMFYFKTGSVFFYDKNESTKILDLKNLSLVFSGLQRCDNNTWIITNNGGLFKIAALSYTIAAVSPGGYSFRNKGHHKIVDTDNPMIKETGMVKSYKKLDKTIQSVFTSRTGTVWFCIDDGIYKQDPGKQPEHYSFTGETNTWNDLANRITDAVEAYNGDMWFYGFCGAVKYSNGRFTHYTTLNGLPEDGRVRKIIIDRDGTVLLTNQYNVLLELRGDTLIPVDKPKDKPGFIADKIKTDNNGAVWIEYNKRLFKMERQAAGKYGITDSLVPFSLTPLAEIAAFAFDGQGNCWIGYTGGKMQVYFLQNSHYNSTNSVTYTADDGLSPMAAFNYDLWPDDNGNILLLFSKQGERKVFVFTTANALEKKKLPTPPVSFTGMIINYKTPDWISMGYSTGPEGLPASPCLPYYNNDITFNYVGTLMNNPSGIVYQVRLEGYDKVWQTTTQTSASYTNLPPGNYTFMVKAANANNVWGEPVPYYFSILPPWYQTWWAKVIFTLAGVALISAAFFLRLHYIRKNDLLKNLRQSNQFKSRLIGLISHDVMVPLRYIAKVSLQLKKYNQTLSRQIVSESLSEINTTATQLHFFGESVIHWIKLQNRTSTPLMEEIDLFKLVNELIKFYLPFATEKKNCIINEVPGQLSCLQDPILIKVILHNLLLNANKFTWEGKISVQAIIEKEALILTIWDNGKGMDAYKVDLLNKLQPIASSQGTNNEPGWGMGYMVIIDLLKLWKGTLNVESKLEEGTKVTVRLPVGEQMVNR